MLAVNFSDRLLKSGLKLDLEKLTKAFDSPSISLSALKNTGVSQLVALTIDTAKKGKISLFKHKTAFGGVDDRYKYIESVIDGIIKKSFGLENTLSDRLDRVLLGKYTGLPVFALIMVVVYFISIRLGGYLGKYLAQAFDYTANSVGVYFSRQGVPKWIVG